jgi:penicillin amidase
LNLFRHLFRALLGRRLPRLDGSLRISGIRRAVLVRRDGWGVPYIEADNDDDAWFGLGFCHGQDRAFQLEVLLRVVRGTLAEWIGKRGLSVDRLSRRIGFFRSAGQQLGVLDADLRGMLAAYAAGVGDGSTRGLPRRPHEFVLLRGRPTPWTAADVLALVKLQSFSLAANWDSELTRLKILLEDGPEALAALDPAYPAWLPVSTPVGAQAGAAVDRLAADLAAFTALVPAGGGSNNWALGPSRTATGRPLLADDPHLPPVLPPHWYLAHVRTPAWAVCGASFVGGPGFPAGHNGFAAWGLTAGLLDNTDLFLEEIGPDGRSVRQGDGFVACEVLAERIAVKGGPAVTEEVLLTPRGPVVGPAFEAVPAAISMRAVWLDPLPMRGMLRLHCCRSFEEFRESLSTWPALSANMVYADETGAVGWQLAGQAPRRRKGWGTLPLPGWDPDAGWEKEPVPFEQMPHLHDPPEGFVATANTRPTPEGTGPFLGADFVDGYRLARLLQVLRGRHDWDLAGCQRLQLDQQSIPWKELREFVLGVPAQDADVRQALGLLTEWDGRLLADSAAATVYEFFVAEMVGRVAKAKAPRAYRWALGQGFATFAPHTIFGLRRLAHLVRLLRAQAAGWFARPWPEELADALGETMRLLRARYGPDLSRWAWGRVRPLTMQHPLAVRKALRRVFNLGPVPWGGDQTTPAQAAVFPLEPAANPAYVATMRLVIDVGNWEASRFVLPGGQSGNPLSRHYGDQFPLWQRGEGIPIAWSAAAVEQATRHALRLVPEEAPTNNSSRTFA